MTEKLTDEQLREIAARKYGVQPLVAMATELLALRAERAKPTQSDEAFEALVRDCAHGEYDGQNGTSAAIARGNAILASIRAEGSAELAKGSQSQWQPIETAPKDGSHILAFRRPLGIRFTNNTNPPTIVHWFEDGFYTSVNEIAPTSPFAATHWQPLPEPPQ